MYTYMYSSVPRSLSGMAFKALSPVEDIDPKCSNFRRACPVYNSECLYLLSLVFSLPHSVSLSRSPFPIPSTFNFSFEKTVLCHNFQHIIQCL
jgi:hypothetical protein